MPKIEATLSHQSRQKLLVSTQSVCFEWMKNEKNEMYIPYNGFDLCRLYYMKINKPYNLNAMQTDMLAFGKYKNNNNEKNEWKMLKIYGNYGNLNRALQWIKLKMGF